MTDDQTTTAPDVLDGWDLGEFTAADMTYPTYRKGSGPGVVVIHEIPGITPLVAAFADEVVEAGRNYALEHMDEILSLLETPEPPVQPWWRRFWPLKWGVKRWVE